MTSIQSFFFDITTTLRHILAQLSVYSSLRARYGAINVVLFANILLALAKIVELGDGLLTIYKYILLASVIISWVNADPYNPIVNFIYRATDPLLRRIRRHMPDTGMLDLSPLVAFALIYVLQIVVFNTAYQYLMTASMSLKLRG